MIRRFVAVIGMVALLCVPSWSWAQTEKRFNSYTEITEVSVTTADLFQLWNGGNIKNISVQNLWDYLTGTKTFASFTGSTIPDSSTLTASLQALETELELKVGTNAALGTPSFTALNMPSSDASPSTTAGQIRHDTTVTGLTGGAVAWWDGTSVRYVVDLDTLPSSDDYVVAYDADADKFYMKVDSSGNGMANTLFDAYTILYADTDDTPAALTVGASTIVGRQSTGGIVAIAEASQAEMEAGTETAMRAMTPQGIFQAIAAWMAVGHAMILDYAAGFDPSATDYKFGYDSTSNTLRMGDEDGAGYKTWAPLDDSATNGDTTKVWSADKVYDLLAGKADTTHTASHIRFMAGTERHSHLHHKGVDAAQGHQDDYEIRPPCARS